MANPESRKPALRNRLPFPFRTILGILHESMGAWRLAADTRSFLRLLADVLLFRVIGRIHLHGANRERRIRIRGGIQIVYRLNRGDIQSIREVWMDEAYELPFSCKPEVIVDLGANIGMTSLYFHHCYPPARIIAVEPSAGNARLARLNLSLNNAKAELIEAAVGPRDGTALFEGSSDSNMGRLSEQGQSVPMVSMATVLSNLPEGRMVDVLKMDIEGGEQNLLTKNTGWLERIRSLVAEFHPDRVDYQGLIAALERAGLTYLPPERTGAMDCFVRPEGDIRS